MNLHTLRHALIPPIKVCSADLQYDRDAGIERGSVYLSRTSGAKSSYFSVLFPVFPSSSTLSFFLHFIYPCFGLPCPPVLSIFLFWQLFTGIPQTPRQIPPPLEVRAAAGWQIWWLVEERLMWKIDYFWTCEDLSVCVRMGAKVCICTGVCANGLDLEKDCNLSLGGSGRVLCGLSEWGLAVGGWLRWGSQRFEWDDSNKLIHFSACWFRHQSLLLIKCLADQESLWQTNTSFYNNGEQSGEPLSRSDLFGRIRITDTTFRYPLLP